MLSNITEHRKAKPRYDIDATFSSRSISLLQRDVSSARDKTMVHLQIYTTFMMILGILLL
jgi:hypothetical protein